MPDEYLEAESLILSEMEYHGKQLARKCVKDYPIQRDGLTIYRCFGGMKIYAKAI